MMAEAEEDDFEFKTTPGYIPPAPKKVDEILNQDKGDDSLNRYKEALIGAAIPPPVYPDDPRTVILKQLTLMFPDEPSQDKTINLDGDMSVMKDNPIVVKEGVKYKIKLNFFVQREIAAGLCYRSKTYRKGVPVAKDVCMIGSRRPNAEPHEWFSDVEEAPKGLIARGVYKIKSHFVDDDSKFHLEWEWGISIKKDWGSEEK